MLIDTKEAAKRLNLSTARVIQLLRENRIPGAVKVGGQRGVWVIDAPSDAPPVVLPTPRQVSRFLNQPQPFDLDGHAIRPHQRLSQG